MRGVGACILVLFPQHDFYGGICGRREIDIGKVCVNICINRGVIKFVVLLKRQSINN